MIKGFSSATAILVIESQIKVLLGINYLVPGFLRSVKTLFQRCHEVNYADLLMGLSAIAFLIVFAVKSINLILYSFLQYILELHCRLSVIFCSLIIFYSILFHCFVFSFIFQFSTKFYINSVFFLHSSLVPGES